MCFVLCEILMLCLFHQFVMITIFLHALHLQCAHCPGLALQQYVYDSYEMSRVMPRNLAKNQRHVGCLCNNVRFCVGSTPKGQSKYFVAPAP